ncbi:ABC transporter substrate-binding protein [Paenibacillus senegalensis]|uniref:ABC transporter substrate-binding protein n=1 Tax=Paenibacillus senegalensis TaxID=1465766 RepID=UPI000289F01C|nr:ABC transporter substrate-binding protein [Paenibacillus senegalensis]
MMRSERKPFAAWHRGLITGLLLAMAVWLLAACGSDPVSIGEPDGIRTETPAPGESNGSGPEATPEGEGETGETIYPLTLIDGIGQEVVIEEEPETMVTLIPSITESAFALGLGDKIVGVSDHSNFPEETQNKVRLGGQTINVEKLLELAPDLAFVTNHHHENHADVLEQLRQVGITVIVVKSSANNFDDVYSMIRLIAEATGTKEEAEELIAGMKDKLEDIQSKASQITEPKKVWIEVFDGLHTSGSNTFMHEMLTAIHAVNVAEEAQGWVQFTEEQVIAAEPDVIVTTYGNYSENVVENVLQRAGWSEVPAVANNQVFDVDNDLVVRPGPQMMDGVEILAKTIYPEVFN